MSNNDIRCGKCNTQHHPVECPMKDDKGLRDILSGLIIFVDTNGRGGINVDQAIEAIQKDYTLTSDVQRDYVPREEYERLSKRDCNATVQLCFDDGINPFQKEECKIVDVGVADNTYVVKSEVFEALQAELKAVKGTLENGCRNEEERCPIMHERDDLKKQLADADTTIGVMAGMGKVVLPEKRKYCPDFPNGGVLCKTCEVYNKAIDEVARLNGGKRD